MSGMSVERLEEKMKDYMVTKMMIYRGDDDIGEEISIEGYVDYDVDYRYGENADGKLGISKMFVEDVFDVNAWDLDGNDITLTDEEKKEASEIITTKFLEG
jgi:hypothetical protein